MCGRFHAFPRASIPLGQALRQEEANESQSMADFLKDLVTMTLTDKVGPLADSEGRAERRSLEAFRSFLFFSRRTGVERCRDTSRLSPADDPADEVASQFVAGRHWFRVLFWI